MLVVKKFGGSSVADKEKIFHVARRCIEDYKKGNQVVVVLSAMGKTTDGLLAQRQRPILPHQSGNWICFWHGGEQTSVALDGDGHVFAWRSGDFTQCVSGGNAYHLCLWKCQI